MPLTALKTKIQNGEDSYTQFKVNITNSDKLAEELVAFSNARGGLLIIGIDDNGVVVGVADKDIRRLNQLIGNVINDNVTPPIYPLVTIENIQNKKLLVIEVEEGVSKPYSTNKGIYLTKAGSDKRKVSPDELRRLFAQSKKLYADEEILPKTDRMDLNIELFYQFVANEDSDIYEGLKSNDLNLETILNNYNIMEGTHLTLAGNLIFGMMPQKFSPSFYIDCIYIVGDDISSNHYLSEKRLKGTFKTLYEDSRRFIVSQLKHTQVEEDFNSNGKLEIDEIVLSELIINAMIHRDYHINAPIKIIMFDDRVEIINPGKLTNSLTVDKIKRGISIHRNPILNSIARYVLKYSGRGSGIKRVLRTNPNVEFINDIEKEEFRCIIPRY
ncbi:ATP-dependent DNA helicase [Candidatus Thiomargarita nelsonii]|uniref:ATP-dependent DNA helicase n=1 Tax=Candidatus Thiomargarita nelsonii TaxID=1003181 RepID=A0A4E0QSA0_9GAMM|nr:ATP-dependent DNA helicase [Candidatus Thiomargarita nelsonii]